MSKTRLQCKNQPFTVTVNEKSTSNIMSSQSQHTKPAQKMRAFIKHLQGYTVLVISGCTITASHLPYI